MTPPAHASAGQIQEFAALDERRAAHRAAPHARSSGPAGSALAPSKRLNSSASSFARLPLVELLQPSSTFGNWSPRERLSASGSASSPQPSTTSDAVTG